MGTVQWIDENKNWTGKKTCGDLLLGLGTAVVQLLDGGLLLVGEVVALLATESLGVMRLIVRSEGGGVDHEDGALDERLRSDQLVTGGVVDDVDDSRVARDALAGPAKVAVVETERAELGVTAHGAHGVHALGHDLGVGGRSSELELSLLVHLRLAATGLSALVP